MVSAMVNIACEMWLIKKKKKFIVFSAASHCQGIVVMPHGNYNIA